MSFPLFKFFSSKYDPKPIGQNDSVDDELKDLSNLSNFYAPLYKNFLETYKNEISIDLRKWMIDFKSDDNIHQAKLYSLMKVMMVLCMASYGVSYVPKLILPEGYFNVKTLVKLSYIDIKNDWKIGDDCDKINCISHCINDFNGVWKDKQYYPELLMPKNVKVFHFSKMKK